MFKISLRFCRNNCVPTNNPLRSKTMSILGFGKKQDDKFIKSIFVDSISCWEHYYDGQKCRIFWRKPRDMWAWVRRMRAKGVVVEKGDYTVGSEYDYD